MLLLDWRNSAGFRNAYMSVAKHVQHTPQRWLHGATHCYHGPSGLDRYVVIIPGGIEQTALLVRGTVPARVCLEENPCRPRLRAVDGPLVCRTVR